MKFRQATGVALICIGLLALVGWIFWPEPRSTVSVNVPISLAEARTRTLPFTADLDWLYLIEIDFTKRGGDKDLSCLTGSSGDCKADGSKLLLSWSLRSDGEAVTSGSTSRSTFGSVGSDGVYIREIGRFRATKGRKSYLTINVVNPVPSLDGYRPYLVVSAFPTYNERQSGITLYVLVFMLICTVMVRDVVAGKYGDRIPITTITATLTGVGTITWKPRDMIPIAASSLNTPFALLCESGNSS